MIIQVFVTLKVVFRFEVRLNKMAANTSSMLNSTEKFSDDEDFFSVLSESSTSRNVTLVLSIVGQLILPPGLLLIIIYEKYGSDKRRTFANKMAASICWAGIAWSLFVHVPWIFRITLGHFSPTVCFAMMLFRAVINNQVSFDRWIKCLIERLLTFEKTLQYYRKQQCCGF